MRERVNIETYWLYNKQLFFAPEWPLPIGCLWLSPLNEFNLISLYFNVVRPPRQRLGLRKRLRFDPVLPVSINNCHRKQLPRPPMPSQQVMKTFHYWLSWQEKFLIMTGFTWVKENNQNPGPELWLRVDVLKSRSQAALENIFLP